MISRTDAQAFLDRLQRATFEYFLQESNPDTGLIRDATREGSHASIAAVGMALSCYPVGVERGFLSRRDAVDRAFRVLRFLWNAPQGTDPEATGHRGLFYHFLDMETGARAWRSELSTMDSAILFAGALTAAEYFDGEDRAESGIRDFADALYRRADWRWATNSEHRISHGWKPERGFLTYHWGGYNEALILLLLALGSPEHAVPAAAYSRWLETYVWKEIYGHGFVYCGPLFTHQLSHVWVDFRGVQDDFMRSRGIDYFENSRRATLVQREYARRNPRGFRAYSADLWGITASDGPGPSTRCIEGRERRFWAYRARGVPWGPDDGTLSPWGTVASLPFAPTEVMSSLRFITREHPELIREYGLRCSFNPTFPSDGPGATGDRGWVSEEYFGLDQGPVVLMIENVRSELVWRLMKRSPYLRRGLERAGFTGGWLDDAPEVSRPRPGAM